KSTGLTLYNTIIKNSRIYNSLIIILAIYSFIFLILLIIVIYIFMFDKTRRKQDIKSYLNIPNDITDKYFY
ncbi:MAG TPA: hypothetical protein VFD03_07050, partial [Clostridia bacterium]|nr:hypothetical protein [Clostridia bacterium]